MSVVRVMKKNQWRDDLDTWVSPIMTNLLWIILCILVVSIPLGFVGLLASMFHWMDDRRTQVFSIFFGTIRKVWLKAYMLFALNLLIGGFLAFNLLIFMQMGLNNPVALVSFGATLFSLVIFVSSIIPAWVLVAIWDVPFKQIVIFSLKLVFLQPFWTIGLAMLITLIIFLSLVMPAAVFLTVTGAIIGYISAYGTYYLVRKYITKNDFQLVDVI